MKPSFFRVVQVWQFFGYYLQWLNIARYRNVSKNDIFALWSTNFCQLVLFLALKHHANQVIPKQNFSNLSIKCKMALLEQFWPRQKLVTLSDTPINCHTCTVQKKPGFMQKVPNHTRQIGYYQGDWSNTLVFGFISLVTANLSGMSRHFSHEQSLFRTALVWQRLGVILAVTYFWLIERALKAQFCTLIDEFLSNCIMFNFEIPDMSSLRIWYTPSDALK